MDRNTTPAPAAATRDLATVREIVEEVRASASTVDEQMNLLFDKFNRAARAIDPSITGAWIGRYGPDFKTPSSIVFERPGAEFGRRS